MHSKASAVNLQLSLNARRQRHLRGFVFGSILAGVILLVGMQSGSFEQSAGILADVILQKVHQQTLSQEQYLQWYVFSELRAPRMVMAMFIGALLAMSGCAMQGLVRNPLAGVDGNRTHLATFQTPPWV